MKRSSVSFLKSLLCGTRTSSTTAILKESHMRIWCTDWSQSLWCVCGGSGAVHDVKSETIPHASVVALFPYLAFKMHRPGTAIYVHDNTHPHIYWLQSFPLTSNACTHYHVHITCTFMYMYLQELERQENVLVICHQVSKQLLFLAFTFCTWYIHVCTKYLHVHVSTLD